MKKSVFFILVPVVILLLSACDCTEGEGPVLSETRDISGFSSVDLQISGDVTLTQDSVFSVKVIAQENLLPLITTDANGDELKIATNTSCIRSNKKIRIEIQMPEVEGISLGGSGNIFGRSQFKVDELVIELSGSGNIEMEVTANKTDSKISGSGTIRLKGTTKEQEIGINGSGDYKSFKLTSYKTKVNIKGSGSTEVFVHNELKAKVSGSGSVYYKGNPDVSSKISGSGNVSRD